MDKKKTTNKLDVQELEKRKAPFASPIMHSDGEGQTGSPGTESVGSRRDPQPDTAPQTQGPLAKPPRIHRLD